MLKRRLNLAAKMPKIRQETNYTDATQRRAKWIVRPYFRPICSATVTRVGKVSDGLENGLKTGE